MLALTSRVCRTMIHSLLGRRPTVRLRRASDVTPAASLSPDNGLALSSLRCSLQAFVLDGDIYYKPSVTGKPLRLTTTEEQNVVNGLSDWTYEGERFSQLHQKKRFDSN